MTVKSSLIGLLIILIFMVGIRIGNYLFAERQWVKFTIMKPIVEERK